MFNPRSRPASQPISTPDFLLQQRDTINTQIIGLDKGSHYKVTVEGVSSLLLNKKMEDNNKRIMKNTVFLYFRMILILIVTLFTSRVVLRELGIEDYGIYNVVGGIVVMLSVITNSLSQAVSRFITFELGKGDKIKLEKVFATSFCQQIILSLIVLLIAEFFGIWFLNTQLNIPPSRMTAAHWVMQCSILVFIFNLISVPYNATIIAHEHMRAFAYISIWEAILKLSVAYAISTSVYDNLIFYAVLLVLVALLVAGSYIIYSIRHFKESASLPHYNQKIFKEMFSFASWNFIGALSGVLQTQGINIILNIFFGPVVYAARGIAIQVESAVNQLASSIASSINPQIIKTYAADKLSEMHLLICRGTKFVYYPKS